MTHEIYEITALWNQGDFVIKSVALILLLVSIASWYVITVRAWHLVQLRRAARAALGFWHASSFSEGIRALDVVSVTNPFHQLAVEGRAALAHPIVNHVNLRGELTPAQWLTDNLHSAINESAEHLQRGLGFLASVGATAPFIGLLGTVWGIYHALVNIGRSGEAGIDKLAGPVGEALVMTALGLAVAIPAVLGYNALTRAHKVLIGKLHRFARQLYAGLLLDWPASHTTIASDSLAREASAVFAKDK